MSNFFYKNGVLFCEDVPVSNIASKYGTPSYVYSKKTLEDNFDAYSNAFVENEGIVCFSVKSLSNISILRLLNEKGSGFDIVSGGELERVIAAGADPKKIIFTGIAKTNAEIIQGIKKDILSFNIESESEMLRIERIAKKEKTIVDVAIRFNPEIDSGGHEYIKTGRKKDKFGILLDGVLKLSKYISSYDSLNLIGLSCHIGSQIFDLNDFKESAKYIKKLAQEINNTGIVTTTDPAIRYCLGVSASPLRYCIALDKVNEFGLSKNINENKNSFHAIIKTYKATEEIAGILNGKIIFIIMPNQFNLSMIAASSSSLGILLK